MRTKNEPETIRPWRKKVSQGEFRTMSKEEKGVFELMLALLVKHGKFLPKLDSSIFTAAVWDNVGLKLYDLAIMDISQQCVCLRPGE